MLGPHLGYVFQYFEIQSYFAAVRHQLGLLAAPRAPTPEVPHDMDHTHASAPAPPHRAGLLQALRRQVEAFSPFVSLILLTSNTTRIFYYLGHRFRNVLLLQSLFAVAVHLLLLCKVLTVYRFLRESGVDGPRAGDEDAAGAGDGDGAEPPADPTVDGPDAAVVDPPPDGPRGSVHVGVEDSIAVEAHEASAWQALRQKVFQLEDSLTNRFIGVDALSFTGRYVCCTLALGAPYVVLLVRVLGAAAVFHNAAHTSTAHTTWRRVATVLVEVVGYAALGIEAALVIPQIIRNEKRKNTKGLHLFLIFSWFIGDAIKVIYYIIDKQPKPFIFCGIFQFCLDFVVLYQYYRYPRGDGTSADAPPHHRADSLVVALPSPSDDQRFDLLVPATLRVDDTAVLDGTEKEATHMDPSQKSSVDHPHQEHRTERPAPHQAEALTAHRPHVGSHSSSNLHSRTRKEKIN
ncbi:hypothetical protein STCU_08327 [Strigomonas culicis]|uniref:Uncharacterized protein n=1 Tax=Strigomonas culicis TaxID=28005 RepID=S9TZS4_9TRYP|nr:hypothetical protein STCU_08327 [Strigomonas culicis]|eukprot:EPY22143.1 hypothetical protein STCU_08327 [Strigomonas culicis]